MSPTKSSMGKRILDWKEQHQLEDNYHTDSALLMTRYIIVILTGTILLSGMIAFLAVMYWCSKQQQRTLKSKSPPSESTPFSTDNKKTNRPTEITLIPMIHNPSYVNTSDFHDNTSSSSSATDSAKQLRKKNLLQQRRGTNSSLTISVAPKLRPISSPPSDCPPDEYLQTATKKLTIDELHQHVQDPRSLYQEFWATPTNHHEKLRIPGAYTKNRYSTILPNEHSRVKLVELYGDPTSSYINANYIHGWTNESNAFIATQGPLANTIIDFYRMIWQEYVPVIVMITRLVENNKSKCERYIPELQASQYGPFYIQVTSTIYKDNYEIRRLIIEHENEQREIVHYWYTAWPDQSCPDTTQPLIELVHYVESSRIELSEINKRSGPVVVHCSAGIGRTGCFIALRNGIKQLNKEHVVDVVRILCDLRRDRGGMIQTNDQYQFLYQALSEYARTLQ